MSETLYERIKRLRIENGLTQTELAYLIGYSDKSMISKIERGLIDISGNTIMKFAQIFHTSPRYLMDGDEQFAPPKPDKFVLDQPKNEEVRGLVRILNKMSPDKIEQVENLLLALYAKTSPELFEEKGTDEHDA